MINLDVNANKFSAMCHNLEEVMLKGCAMCED